LAFGQNVLSQNAVGYVKVTVAPGDLALVSQDFDDIDGNPQTISTVIGDQLPANSAAFIWDAANQQFNTEDFVPAAKGEDPTWTPDTNALARGVGFFIQAASDAASAADVYLLGEVPSIGITDLDKAPGLTMLGIPYPATVDWTNTALALEAVTNDVLFIWDQTGQAYNPQDFVPTAKGQPPEWPDKTLQIAPGEGFFYDNVTTNTLEVTETKPYTWP
jgi:hypothetical protein